MIEDMTIRNLSPATQQSYVYALARFSRHFGKPPDRFDVEDVRAYQVHLVAGGMSWSTISMRWRDAGGGTRFSVRVYVRDAIRSVETRPQA